MLMKHACALFVLLVSAGLVHAQAPGVPVYAEGRGAKQNAVLMAQAKKLQAASALLSMTKAMEQAEHTHCDIALPEADAKPLAKTSGQ